MGYEIVYAHLDLPELEREERAIQDLWDWFKPEQRQLIREVIGQCRTLQDVDQLNIALSFGGVEGYPVRCLIKHYWGENVLARWSEQKCCKPISLYAFQYAHLLI